MAPATRHKPANKINSIVSLTIENRKEISEQEAIELAKNSDENDKELYSMNTSSTAYIKYFNYYKKRKDVKNFNLVGKLGFSFNLANVPNKLFVCMYI